MTQMIQLSVESIELGRVVCKTDSDITMICSSLSSSSLQSLTVGRLELGDLEMQELRFVKGEVIQLAAGLMSRIAKRVCYPSLTASVVTVLKRFIKLDKVDCWGESSLDSLTLLLSTPTLQSWTVDQVNLHRNA